VIFQNILYSLKSSLKSSLNSSITIIKIVIPIYIIADIVYYYNLLEHISFLVSPITDILDLPKEASLAIISGIFLNLYVAIAFASPIGMDNYEWSILAIFLGICHSLVVEGSILKKISIPYWFSYSFRFFSGLFIAYLSTLIPKSFFNGDLVEVKLENPTYDSFIDLLISSTSNAIILTFKIIILISIIIIIMDMIKNTNFIKNSKNDISKAFPIFTGLLLGITYGAGILIAEAKNINKKDLLFISVFLMICHAIIEDTLLFVLFGADFTIVILTRLIWAIILSYLAIFMYSYIYKS